MAKTELLWRKKNEKLQFFEPNGIQERAISMVAAQSDMVYTVSTANGTGKSYLLAALCGNLVFGPQNKWFDYPLFKDFKGPRRIRYITTPKNLEENGPFYSAVKELWPKGRYETLKAGQHYYSQIKANGWVIDLMSYDQEPSQFEGPNIGVILMDEPCPKNLWTPNISRLRSGGFALIAMTPLTEAGWFFDEIVPRHSEAIIYGDVEENCSQHGIRGRLEHSRIEQLIGEYDEDEREARVKGRAMYLSGLIYKTFFPNVHVLKKAVIPNGSSTIYQSVDPHSDKPFASVWGMVEQNGDVYIIDEYPNEPFEKMHNCQLTIHDYRNIFMDKEAGWNVQDRVIDRHFADVANAINKRTLRQELEDIGLSYKPSYKASEEMETGILKVRHYLAYDNARPIDSLNKPKLYINPHCHNTIKAFQRWARDPENGKVKEDFKDFCDCIRMLLMLDLKIDEPLPYEEPVKRW